MIKLDVDVVQTVEIHVTPKEFIEKHLVMYKIQGTYLEMYSKKQKVMSIDRHYWELHKNIPDNLLTIVRNYCSDVYGVFFFEYYGIEVPLLYKNGWIVRDKNGQYWHYTQEPHLNGTNWETELDVQSIIVEICIPKELKRKIVNSLSLLDIDLDIPYQSSKVKVHED